MAVTLGSTGRHTRRGLLGWLGAGAALPALAACAAPGGQAPSRPETLTGGFELISQNWPPLNAIHEQAVASFQQQNPQTKLTVTNVPYGEIATKVSASLAAGAGPDGYFHYSGFWRGVDAASVMRPLTPQLFRRNELERITYANLLSSVPAKNNEVYFLPAFVGMGGAGILYNTALLAGAGVDPATFNTLDAILAGAAKLVVREGATIKRAGLLHAHTPSLIFRWILDQGGKFYDERASRWQLQTVEAERAMQWLLDLYDKHGVTWRKPPDGVKDALGEGQAAMSMTGPFALSGYVKSFPDVRLEDRPLPGFVPGKAPNYFEPELAGYSLSALLKPDEPKTRIGVAFLRHLLAPDNAMLLANEYSGAILVKGVYEDPRFKDTTFGAVRARLPEQIISKIVLIPTGANPYDFGTQINKVVAGELSIRAALAEAQQIFNTQEDDARRNRA
jgi:ABC-type glycerol-3-phosphate transport system substrate-binding protein